MNVAIIGTGYVGLVTGACLAEFHGLDLALDRTMMAQPVLFDTRNALDPAHALKLGFAYFGTGRGQQAVAEAVQ